MLFEECPLGRIHYRLPNIAEGPKLLGLCGINSKRIQDKTWMEDNELLLYSKVIENLSLFITTIEIDYEGKKIEKFGELLDIKELRVPIYSMAGKVLSSISDIDEKKKS